MLRISSNFPSFTGTCHSELTAHRCSRPLAGLWFRISMNSHPTLARSRGADHHHTPSTDAALFHRLTFWRFDSLNPAVPAISAVPSSHLREEGTADQQSENGQQNFIA